MRCPNCQNEDTKVLDSRPVEEGNAIRRRRECEKCAFRFSTYEEMEILDLAVIKKDGSREPYSREKLERGLRRAFEKREHTDQTMKKLVSAIEQDIQKKTKDGEIKSLDIGEIVMKRIKKVDKVAYIRFDSVYRQFEDVEEFKEEIKKL
jgi:transcriptional repressor NrdR